MLLIAAWLLLRPQGRPSRWDLRLGGLVAAMTLLRIAAVSPFALPLLIAVVFGVAAASKQGSERRLLATAGASVMTLVLYRFAQQQIPLVWLATDRIGSALGHMTAVITGKRLEIGASFAGLDFLVLTGVFWIGCARQTIHPRGATWWFTAGCLVAGHLCYLAILAHAQQLCERLPPVELPTHDNPYIPPPFCWSTIARQMVPWHLPVIAALWHGGLTVWVLRTAKWERVPTAAEPIRFSNAASFQLMSWLAIGLIALLIPLVGSLHLATTTLQDKQILANEQDDIDYLVAQHDAYGQQSAGMYGLLPAFVQSLGGNLLTSATLSDEQLEQADVLLLLHPNESIAQRHQPIWDFVRAGGHVLIVSAGFTPAMGTADGLTTLLQPTAISVSQDSATSETRDWQASYTISAHAAFASINGRSTRFLSDAGASLQVSWGARPLIVGRWGWSAPQQDANWDESRPLETGARLGDLVLAAEQRVGRGSVVVLGDDTSLTNEGLTSAYPFVGNLLSHLAHGRSGPQAPWRQALGLLGSFTLVVLVFYRREAWHVTVAAVVLLIGLVISQALSAAASQVVPDGTRIHQPSAPPLKNRLAYIDQSHLEAYSLDDWGFDSLNGLPLNLMRNGYLPLMLPEFSVEQLDRAGLLISIAPARRFERRECAMVKGFVERGGTLISLVGAEQAAASNPLLAEFGMHVPISPLPPQDAGLEPEPFGRTRALYLEVASPEAQDSYQVGARLHAAWPVEPLSDEIEVLAYGHNQLRVVDSDTELPVIVSRSVGDGTVVLIGDSGFAMNKNLEYVGGEPFEGGYENAQFWRWLLARLGKQPAWIPPRGARDGTPPSEPAPEASEGDK